MNIYHEKNPYNEGLINSLKLNKSEVFFKHKSDGILFIEEDSKLISILIYKNLSFPYESYIEFHIEMLAKNKYLGAICILNAIEKLQDLFESKELITRHSKHELNTLLMFNDLGCKPIEYSRDGDLNIILKKSPKSHIPSNSDDKIPSKNFKLFLKKWLAADVDFFSIEEFQNDYSLSLTKSNIQINNISPNISIIVNNESNEALIYQLHKSKRKELILVFNFFQNTNIKNVFFHERNSRLEQLLFLSGFSNTAFKHKSFKKWSR